MRILIENFTKRFGETVVIKDMNLDIHDGEMLALLGPSGCGKSTTLYAICGVYRVDGGRILFGDRDVSNLPSQKRNVGVVFQSYALYPHMKVFDNIAFPLQMRKEKADEIRKKVAEIADLLHIRELLDRLPGQLSGGQQQRVSLGRALVRRPEVLLLDEPLANLDAKLRLEMRSEIRRLQLETGITSVLVTHDQVEAMSMCDRIAIMDQGKIHQVATPTEMYDNPASSFVAGFLGNPPIVFLRGTMADGRFSLPEADLSVNIPSRLSSLENGRPVEIGIRPEFVQPELGREVKGKICFIEPQGRESLFDIRLGDGSILRSIQPARDDLKLNDSVAWGLNSERILVFDENGDRI